MLSIIWTVCGLSLITTGMPMVGCAALVGAVLWQMVPGDEE